MKCLPKKFIPRGKKLLALILMKANLNLNPPKIFLLIPHDIVAYYALKFSGKKFNGIVFAYPPQAQVIKAQHVPRASQQSISACVD